MATTDFVPQTFNVPTELATPQFTLEPLGPEHNQADHLAWMSSIDHIHATPGYPDGDWPHEMSLDQNRDDLIRHRRDFADRRGFTYTVLDPDGTVIGCVYIYPLKDVPHAAHVSSWVTASRGELDTVLYQAVTQWLGDAWPFERIEYAARDIAP